MRDIWNAVDVALARFGLPPQPQDRDTIIAELDKQIALEEDEEGDQFLMRLLCAQLFSLGHVDDSLRVWRAKSCNFDTHLGIDVQFVCGAGLEATKSFLRESRLEDASEALEYIAECETSGDFAGFTPERVLEQARFFYKCSDPHVAPGDVT